LRTNERDGFETSRVPGSATVKIVLDTSVLVAAIVHVHPRHDRAFPWLVRARTRELIPLVCTHTLAELYAVLTTLPTRPRIGPSMARRLIRENVERTCQPIQLDSDDYRAALDRMAELGLSGGVVYDMLAVIAAEKASADTLLTLNLADFRRAWPEGVDRIVEP